jgi:hypothetical protein
MTKKQELSIKLNKLIDDFEKKYKCTIKDLNFTIKI